MKFAYTHIVLGLVTGVASLSALAAPAGRVLFTQPGTEIVNERGEKRPARRGDPLETGDRLVTPAGSMAQVLLPDGSLVGLRPGSDLKLELPPQASATAGQVMSLLGGSLRVIGSELMDNRKPSALTLNSGLATLKLTGADLETALVKASDVRTQGAPETGSYSRLLVGTGSIGNGAAVEPLSARQVSFVGGVNVAPVTVAAVSPTLFAATPVLTTAARGSLPALVSGGTVPDKGLTATAPLATTSTLTAPVLIGTRTAIAAPIVTSTAIVAPVINQPVVVAAAPIVVAPIQPVLTYVAPIVTKVPVTTTIIKTCTVTLIGGKKVCI